MQHSFKVFIKRLGHAIKTLRFPRTGSGGTYSRSWFLPGANYDYHHEAGLLWENSVVLACLNWIVRTFPEAPLKVKKYKKQGHYEIPREHPIVELIKQPNPFYDSWVLWAGTLLSLNCDGNAYWYKQRSQAGKVVQLWYIPHFHIEPKWKEDGSEFISGYAYHIDGKFSLIPQEDIVHLRAGIPNPINVRKGLSPLSAVVREICTDNEAATFSASLLRNMGIPGAIITPIKDEIEFSPEQHEKLLQLWSAKFRGERRGEPLVAPLPLQISNPGFSPEQMALDKVRRIPEERISAALGISSIVVGLGAGLERATYSNYREAREAAYESNIIPTQRMIASQLNSQLLSEFSDEKQEELFFDISEILGLREDQDRLHARILGDYQGGIITRAEARSTLGWPTGEKDEVYVYQI